MKILCTQALEGAFPTILPHLPGDQVIYGTTGQLVAELEAGRGGDLLLAARPALEELATLGKVAAGSLTDIASTPVAIGIREGVGKLDLSSVDALKKLLLAAGPIAYPDPAGGGVSGVHFAHMLDRLGIAEEVNRHAILVKAGGVAAEYLVSHQAALAVQMVSELMMVPGIEIAGTLPGEYAKVISFSGAVVSGAAHAQEALDVIQALKTPAAKQILESAGLTPAL